VNVTLAHVNHLARRDVEGFGERLS